MHILDCVDKNNVISLIIIECNNNSDNSYQLIQLLEKSNLLVNFVLNYYQKLKLNVNIARYRRSKKYLVPL